MKRIMLFMMAALMGVATVSAQGYYTRYCADKKLVKKANKWMKKGEWRNGFSDASPHASVNAVEFYQQYHKNPKQWQALFKWLDTTDLLAIKKGKHNIPGSNLVASVEDSRNQPLSKRKSESHASNIDFQLVVKGVERFGIIDHYTSKPNCAYRPDVVHYDYDDSRARFYDSNPKEFFIFFPADWHIAKVETPLDDQDIRVVVIKVDYVD